MDVLAVLYELSNKLLALSNFNLSQFSQYLFTISVKMSGDLDQVSFSLETKDYAISSASTTMLISTV